MSESLKLHQFPEVCRLSLDVSCCLPSPEPGPAAPPWPMAAARTAACGCRRWRAPTVRRPPAPGDGGRMWWSKVRADQGWDSWDGEYFHGIWDFYGSLWEVCGSWWGAFWDLEIFGDGWLIVENWIATINIKNAHFPTLSWSHTLFLPGAQRLRHAVARELGPSQRLRIAWDASMCIWYHICVVCAHVLYIISDMVINFHEWSFMSLSSIITDYHLLSLIIIRNYH